MLLVVMVPNFDFSLVAESDWLLSSWVRWSIVLISDVRDVPKTCRFSTCPKAPDGTGF